MGNVRSRIYYIQRDGNRILRSYIEPRAPIEVEGMAFVIHMEETDDGTLEFWIKPNERLGHRRLAARMSGWQASTRIIRGEAIILDEDGNARGSLHSNRPQARERDRDRTVEEGGE